MKKEQGFSLIEVMVALLITGILMAAVFLLLQKGQNTFNREPEVADMNQSSRAGLDRISRDLAMAGYQTPAAMAVLWQDGGGIVPDQLTIVYADQDVPISRPIRCGDTGNDKNNDNTANNLSMNFSNWTNWTKGLARPNSGWETHPALVGEETEVAAMMMQRKKRRPPSGGGSTGGGTTDPGGTDPGGTDPGGTDPGGSNGGGPCGTINNSAVVNVDPTSFSPSLYEASQDMDTEAQARVEGAYDDGMVLFAIETSDCNGDGQIGAFPFEVTQDPKITSAGGSPTLNINHNPGQGTTGLNLPGGFNGEVHPDCAIIGLFHMVQYRINPPPPTDNPLLERRDLALGGNWVPVSNNIENLQAQYAVGGADLFMDAPATPLGDDPTTWVTRVKVTISGRSETTNLEGATQGVFAAEDTHLRNAFSTTVTLRNQAYNAQIFAEENQHLTVNYKYN
jgi:prepilin-type N-terminal cleavage/methylation domain-containing protein